MTVATATLKDEALQPQAPGGLTQGALLALLAHGGLIVALSLGVQWRAQAPEPVAAELWAPLPEVAAPKPEEVPVTPVVPPLPTPPLQKVEAPQPDPQIAIEREQEREKKKRLAEREEQLQREQTAREKKAAEERLVKQREENLKRMMGQIGSTVSSGTAAQDAGPSKSYAGRLVAQIKPNIVFNDNLPGNPAAEVEVRAGASGSIMSRRLVKSSGSKEWDEAVLRAIDRTGTLPRDVDGRVPSTIIVAFRPQE